MSRRVVHALSDALRELMRENPGLVAIGEDIADPYGGAFKVTKGLSTEFPAQVISTPISEAGLTGVAIGMAMRGLTPVVEIMFGDFVTLVADQLINHASKLASLYGKGLPLVVRTPMGGGRGYGPTHSQSLESLYMGVPGLTVLAVSHLADPGKLLRHAVSLGSPVLFVENKILYAQFLADPDETTGGDAPTVFVRVGEEEPDVTVVAYGGMVPVARKAADRLLAEEGLCTEIVVPHRLAPLDAAPLARSAARTRRLVVVEEGAVDFGWGCGVLAACSGLRLDAPPVLVGAKASPIPACRCLESAVLPQADDVFDAVIRTVDGRYT